MKTLLPETMLNTVCLCAWSEAVLAPVLQLLLLTTIVKNESFLWYVAGL